MARKPKIVSRKPAAPTTASEVNDASALPEPAPAPMGPAETGDRASIRDREAARVFALAADYHRRRLYDDAVRAYSRALNLDPTNPDIYNNLGAALRSQGKLAAACACYRRSLVLRPNHAGTLANLGNAMREQGNLRSAIGALSQALRQAPQSTDVIFNLGLAMRAAGDVSVAVSCFESVIAVDKDHAMAHSELAFTLLAQQDYVRGFHELEWRRQTPVYTTRSVDAPEWDGSDLGGKTILVLGEGSAGDVVQFARYIPLIKEKGGNVIVECHATLARLLATFSGVDRVIMSGGQPPACDVYAPVMSLPKILGRTGGVEADMVPYISPPDVISLQLPPARRNQMRVGLTWAPNVPASDNDPRVCPLGTLMEVLSVPGVAAFSLQTGRHRTDLETDGCDVLLPDIGNRINDISDTAAMINQLDLVICADSVTAHLAGAMNKPVWLLAPAVADWRWGYKGETSPWYPSMRIFRQPAFGDWSTAIAGLRDALSQRVTARFGDGG